MASASLHNASDWLFFLTPEKQLRSEIRSLIWLAMLTDRSVIIPNLLGDDRVIRTIDQVYNRTMWPGFRVATIAKRVKVREHSYILLLVEQ